MQHYQTLKRIAHRAEDIYRVVADVAHYQNFLPLVERSTVRDIRVGEDQVTRFQAALMVGYAPLHIHETFMSEVTADPRALTVTTSSTGNAISKLLAFWKITALTEKSCEISFSMEYEMKSFMFQLVLSRLFDQAVNRIVKAFEARAAELYSRASGDQVGTT